MQLLSKYIDENLNISSNEKQHLIYFIKCIFYDLSKLIVFITFFICIKRINEFLYAFILSFPLRIVSGGLHFKKYWSCFGFSFLYFTLLTIPLAHVRLPYSISIIILLACSLIIFLLAPIQSASRPPLPNSEIFQCKKKAVFASLYGTILTTLFFDTYLASTGFWTIVLHTLQLVIAFLLKKRGEQHV